MIDEQKLYELLKDFDPAVGERMEKHFREGAFYMDSGTPGSSWTMDSQGPAFKGRGSRR